MDAPSVRGRRLTGGALAGIALLGAPRRPLGAQAPAAACAAASDDGAAQATAWPDAASALARYRGRRIDTVRVVTLGPDRVRGLLPRALHATTHDATVRRLLLFAPGDAVDPARVAESLRQLRALHYLAGASVAASCRPGGVVTLTVTTRDQWSLKPRLRVGSAGGAGGTSDAVAGLEETNLLGTGRAARLYVRSDRGRVGAGASFADPALFGSRYTGAASRDVYRDGSAWAALVRTRPSGAFERWGVGATLRHSALESVVRETPASAGPGDPTAPATAPGDSVRRTAAELLVSRRLGTAPRAAGGATFLLAGVEAERTALSAGVRSQVVGPVAVRRTFVGADVGVARRSARYVAVPWLVPAPRAADARGPDARAADARPSDAGGRENPAELPLGTQADAVVGLGRDLAARAPAAHVDAWLGRAFPAGRRGAAPRAVVTADVWASGYHALGGAPTAGAAHEWSAGTARAELGIAAPAPRGLWVGRLGAERLADPDPDLRGLAMSDPVLRALPARTRLAEAAFGASLERSVHLRPVTHAFVLDAALFGAASMRWDPAVPLSTARRAAVLGGTDPDRLDAATAGPALAPPRVGVGSVGVGLRLVPTAFGRSSVRLDVGVPVVRTAGVPARPFVGVKVTPAFGAPRARDGAAGLPTP